MRRAWTAFWNWYERHYVLNVSIAVGLFLLQLLHLYWLSGHVVALRLTDMSYFSPSGALKFAILLIDYAEIPALVGISLVYVNALRGGFSWGPVLMLAFLNSQWLHIFWITDEFVVTEFSGEPAQSSLPPWLAWCAILIDYLELPVIFDTLRRLAKALRARPLRSLLKDDVRAN